jgi:hypothetical protein
LNAAFFILHSQHSWGMGAHHEKSCVEDTWLSAQKKTYLATSAPSGEWKLLMRMAVAVPLG